MRNLKRRRLSIIPPKNKNGIDFHKQGSKSRAKGKDFEDKLDKAFAYYKARGYAQIDKTPEPLKVLRSLEAGRFIAAFDKKAQPDYKGTIKGGRSVMFEAKYTASDRITADRVTEEQWEYLSQAASLGAFCYILAGFNTGSVYKIPWEIWSKMKDYFGRKYVTEADLTQYQVQLAWNGLLQIIN